MHDAISDDLSAPPTLDSVLAVAHRAVVYVPGGAPDGKVCREWVGIPELDEQLWLELLRESIEFVRP